MDKQHSVGSCRREVVVVAGGCFTVYVTLVVGDEKFELDGGGVLLSRAAARTSHRRPTNNERSEPTDSSLRSTSVVITRCYQLVGLLGLRGAGHGVDLPGYGCWYNRRLGLEVAICGMRLGGDANALERSIRGLLHRGYRVAHERIVLALNIASISRQLHVAASQVEATITQIYVTHVAELSNIQISRIAREPQYSATSECWSLG